MVVNIFIKYQTCYNIPMAKDTHTFTDRLPPQDIDSEMALLGSLLLTNEAYYEVADMVSDKSFYSERNRVIWTSITELINKKIPADAVTLATDLRERKSLDQIGGAAYIGEIMNTVGTATNVKYYAQIVAKKYMLRRLITASNKIAEKSYEEALELGQILEEAEKEIYDITSYGSGSQRLIAVNELIEEAWARIERLQDGDGEALRGIPSGIPKLDNMLSGFQKSDLIILAARPSVGKTSLVMDFVRHAAVDHGHFCAVFSLEMSKEQLFDRMLAAQAKVDGWKLRTGNLDMHNDIERLQNGLNDLAKAPIYIDDTPANNIVNMRSVLRRLKAEKPIEFIVVDYLQLMSTTKNYDSMVNQVTDISRSLKQLAKEFRAPVIALSQLSRSVEQRGGKPRLSDLRDSGSIEQDADVVMFIHREDKYGEENKINNQVELLIEKHRNGSTGKVDLVFDAKRTSFSELTKDQFGDAVNTMGISSSINIDALNDF